MKKLLAPGGALGVFAEHPMLLRLAGISVCAEIAWATLLIVLQFHIKDELSAGVSSQRVAARIATVTLAFVGCETLFKVPMGHLSDKIGPRPLIFFALGLCSLTPLSMYFAHDWWHFAVLRALDGLAAAALWPAMSSLMARAVSRDAKAAAMSVFNGAYCLGLAVGPVVGLTIGHLFGNTKVFPLCATLMAVGLVVAITVLKPGVGDKPAHAEHEDEHPGPLLRGRPMLVRMLLIYALSQAAVALFANVAALYVDERFGIKEGDLPKLVALPALFVAGASIPLGRMGDTIGRAKAVWISYILAAIGMVCVALTSLGPEPEHLFSPLLGLFVVGLLGLVASYILGTPAWLGLTSLQVGDSQQARALSMMQFAQGMGVVIGSALVASAGQFMAHFQTVKELVVAKVPGKFGHNLQVHVQGTAKHANDPLPLGIWMWLSALVFVVCLVLTLRYVHETSPPSVEPDWDDEVRSEPSRQPLEVSGA